MLKTSKVPIPYIIVNYSGIMAIIIWYGVKSSSGVFKDLTNGIYYYDGGWSAGLDTLTYRVYSRGLNTQGGDCGGFFSKLWSYMWR